MSVRGEHHLLARQVDTVEGVQEFFLHACLVGQKMNVVDRQQVEVAELIAEGVKLVRFKRDDVLVGKILRRQVHPAAAGAVLMEAVADALQEVGFADAVAAVEKERVEGAFFLADNGHRGVVGQLVFGSYNKGIEHQL